MCLLLSVLAVTQQLRWNITRRTCSDSIPPNIAQIGSVGHAVYLGG